MNADREVRGERGRSIYVQMSGIPGDNATAYVHIRALGPRGGERAHALLLTHNAPVLSTFALRLSEVANRSAERASIGYGRGWITAVPLRLPAGLRLTFRGRRGGYIWEDFFDRDASLALCEAVDLALAHLLGPTRREAPESEAA